jgi:hypothetical protein
MASIFQIAICDGKIALLSDVSGFSAKPAFNFIFRSAQKFASKRATSDVGSYTDGERDEAGAMIRSFN